jgi:hypothetical protein
MSLVKARYLGDTPHVFPILADPSRQPRPDGVIPGPLSDEEAAALGVPAGVFREVLVCKGDVILLPADEATDREDFEVVGSKARKAAGADTEAPVADVGAPDAPVQEVEV